MYEKLTESAMEMLDTLERVEEEIDEVIILVTTNAGDGTNIYTTSTCNKNYHNVGLLDWARDLFTQQRSIIEEDSLDDEDDIEDLPL